MVKGNNREDNHEEGEKGGEVGGGRGWVEQTTIPKSTNYKTTSRSRVGFKRIIQGCGWIWRGLADGRASCGRNHSLTGISMAGSFC